jgi:hypothetical protein
MVDMLVLKNLMEEIQTLILLTLVLLMVAQKLRVVLHFCTGFFLFTNK